MLLERGIDPVITFHHFTTPRWAADAGGWSEPATAEHFARFCGRAAGELADVLRRVCTLNEPNVVATGAFLAGSFPPGTRDPAARRRANRVFIDAHRQAVEAIREAAPGVPVGMTLAMTDWQAAAGGEDKLERIRSRYEDEFLAATDGDDFLGVQTYSRARVGPDGTVEPDPGADVIDTMGYEYYPQALEATLRRAWHATAGKLPLLVTENGIATEDDQQRIRFVKSALDGVLRCLEDGIDVQGYTYWSLLDNFEWSLGYRPRFGMVAVDRTTFERAPKPSARWFAQIARSNTLA